MKVKNVFCFKLSIWLLTPILILSIAVSHAAITKAPVLTKKQVNLQSKLTIYATSWSEYGNCNSKILPPYQYDGAYDNCSGAWNNRPVVSNNAMLSQFNQADVIPYSFMQVWNPDFQNSINQPVPSDYAGYLHFSDMYGELPPSSDSVATKKMIGICQALGSASCSDYQLNGTTNKIQFFQYLQNQTVGQLNTFNAFMNMTLASQVQRIIAIGGANTIENNAIGYYTYQAIFQNKTVFLNNLNNWLGSYSNLKGFDFDFEPPINSSGEQIPVNNYTQLANDYMSLLNVIKQLRSIHKDIYISVTLTSNMDYLAAINNATGNNDWFKQLSEVCDSINIMTYDLHGPWGASSDPDTAIHTYLAQPTISNINQFGIQYGADQIINQILSFGVPASKLQIGLASYGRAYAGVDAGSNLQLPGFNQPWTTAANMSSDVSPQAGLVPYKALPALQTGIDNYNFQNYDVLASINGLSSVMPVGSYLYDKKNQIFIGYESPAEVKSVCSFIKAKQLRGAIMWSADTDLSVDNPNSLVSSYETYCGN